MANERIADHDATDLELARAERALREPKPSRSRDRSHDAAGGVGRPTGDELRAIQGLFLGILLACPVWVGLAWVVYKLISR